MLADDLKELISAAIDRELSPDETRQVRELLKASPEARAFYNQLKADRDRLRGLLPVPPPADLHDRIMARLPQAAPLSTPAPAGARRNGVSRHLVPVALAASLLISLTATSFWYFSQQNDNVGPDGSPSQVVQRPSSDTNQASDGWAGILPREQGVLPPAPPIVEPPHEPVAKSSDPPLIDDSIPPPRAVQSPPRDTFAFPPVPPVAPFDLARVRVPFLASVAELGRDDVSQALLEDLSFHPAVRVDLFSSDPGRGADLFRAAAKAQGLTLFADPSVSDRIKRKQGTAYLVYFESLTPAEVRSLLLALASADGKNKSRVFETLHLSTAVATDAKELKELLGIDPGLWKRPPDRKDEPPLDPKKPISSGTADEVARNLTAPSAKVAPKAAMLLTFGPDTARIHPVMSAEIKKYLSQRGPRKDHAIPVMIVIR